MMEVFRKHGVVSDVIDAEPNFILKIKYGDTNVEPGMVLTPINVQTQPTLEWPAEDGCFYTVVMTDPDAPSRENPKMGEWHHWLVVNVPGCDVSQGEVKSAYVGSGPPKGTKLHRYVFLVFKQPGNKTDFSALPNLELSGANRAKKKVRDFLAKPYKFTELVAANFFNAEFDECVPKLHAKLSGK